ncbi:MAG: TPM domain-containing protein [Xanthomonadaceae bacterium]|nr:TPM domain-containing protein [Xanthomonadaceae bacterium]MDE1962347.1 TPM domain-containing protein [Xanthomonadaceae bacterium]
MARIERLARNLFGAWFQLRRCFPSVLLDEMAVAIRDGERRHRGELRFAVESRLSPTAVWTGMTARQRAQQVFARLGVWDTELNTGVLVYVLLAERRIEIVADRGLAAPVGREAWERIGVAMRAAFAAGRWREGSLEGIAAIHALAAEHFPSDGRDNPDELPDRPVLL